MTHHGDNSPMIGAIIGALGGIYKSMIGIVSIVTYEGIQETAIYAIIGSVIGASVSFLVTHGLKKLFKIKK